ncbi:MAG: hypothetical protein IPH75_00035 [bacterium]|nr:hypothetical protein [bacterium]
MENRTEYDIVIMDAFGSSSIPFHLVTEESFALIKEHLSAGGSTRMKAGWRDQRAEPTAQRSSGM